MNRRVMVFLGVLLFGLVSIALLQTRSASQSTIDVAGTLNSFYLVGRDLGFTPEDIQAVRLRDPRGSSSFIIARDGNGVWTAPGSSGTLNTGAAEIIAKTVALLPYMNTSPIDASTKLSDFGFNPEGQFAIEVVLLDGSGHSIAIGSLSASQVTYYALVDERAEVLFLERAPVDYLATQLNKPPLT
jgi:hypothetical protein